MKRSILSIQGLLCMIVFALMTSCTDEGVEVVSQDTSWQIDQQYIDSDIREQLKLDPYTDLVYIGAGDLDLNIHAHSDTKNISLDDSTLTFKVKVTNVRKEDLKVSIKKDDSFLKNYLVNVEGVPTLPDNAYTLTGNVIKAGELETIVTMKFTDPGKMTSTNGYASAFVLTMEGATDHIRVAKTRNLIFVRTDLTIKLDNVDSSNAPISGTSFNTGLTFDGNAGINLFPKLTDGNINSDEWYPGSTDGYLIINVNPKSVINGIMVNTDTGTSYSLKKCDISADLGNGQWVDFGTYDRTTKSNVANIKFKTPIEVSRLRISNIRGFSGTGKYVSFYEIHLYK